MTYYYKYTYITLYVGKFVGTYVYSSMFELVKYFLKFSHLHKLTFLNVVGQVLGSTYNRT